MHDPPHLIKNVRNNLLTYDFLIGDSVVSFDHIVKLFELEDKSSLRFVPKLTRCHIEMNNFKKMNVKLATQVLSHSVASAIDTYIKLNKMTDVASDTAINWFVERVDRLFDIMNSNTTHTKHKWKKPLSLQTVDQFHELESSVEWIEAWKFQSKKKKKL